MKNIVTGANGYMAMGIAKQLIDDHIEAVTTDITVDNIDDRAKKYLET